MGIIQSCNFRLISGFLVHSHICDSSSPSDCSTVACFRHRNHTFLCHIFCSPSNRGCRSLFQTARSVDVQQRQHQTCPQAASLSPSSRASFWVPLPLCISTKNILKISVSRQTTQKCAALPLLRESLFWQEVYRQHLISFLTAEFAGEIYTCSSYISSCPCSSIACTISEEEENNRNKN